MNLSLTANQQQLKATVTEFMERECPRDRLVELHDGDTGLDGLMWQKAAEIGLLGSLISEEHGGSGSSLMDAAIIFQALGSGPLEGPYFSSGILGSLVVQACGSDEQKDQLLPGIARGSEVCVLAFPESDYGWTPNLVSTTAENRRGEFVVDGTKLFVHDAMSATQLLCVARIDGQPGVSVVVIDADAEGVSRRPLKGFGGKVGEVKFNSVRVPESSLLGGDFDIWPKLKAAIGKAIPILSAYQAGGCEAVVDIGIQYSRTRKAFGVPIGRFQRVQDHIIEALNRMDAAKWTAYEALSKLDSGKNAISSVHLAKAVASEGYYHACNFIHEAHGGIGTSREYGLTLHTEMSRSLYNYLGEPKYHRRQMVKSLLT